MVLIIAFGILIFAIRVLIIGLRALIIVSIRYLAAISLVVDLIAQYILPQRGMYKEAKYQITDLTEPAASSARTALGSEPEGDREWLVRQASSVRDASFRSAAEVMEELRE